MGRGKETLTKSDIPTRFRAGGSVRGRSHASTNGLDNKGDDVLEQQSVSTLGKSSLDIHTQVQNTIVSGRSSDNAYLSSWNQLTQPRAQTTVLGTELSNEASHDHKICGNDESGTDNRRRDPRLKM